MSNKFIFDVDGTLTPSRKSIDPNFRRFFLEFAESHFCYLVTGSDRKKTLEQVGEEICNACIRVYNCSGTDVYEEDRNVRRVNWDVPDDLVGHLYEELDRSEFPIRNGLHLEYRPGGLNFSILGRGSGEGWHRDEYVKWDKKYKERKNIASRLKEKFSDIEVQVGGQTGLDLAPKGNNKSMILSDFSTLDKLHFFGDMMEEGENDYPLAKAVKDMGGIPYHVKNWKETRTILKGFHDLDPGRKLYN
jgi:phosphomannomutase